MKRTLVLFLIAVLLPSIGFSQEAPPAALPSVILPQELDRVLRDYERGWREKDAAGLSQLFAEDGFVLSSGKPPVRGRDAIRQAYTGSGGPLVLRAMSYSTSGDTGYIIGAFKTADDAPDMGKFILALRRDGNGKWLIAADMDNMNSSPRRAAAPPAPAPAQ
jgi:ketosteroid isomerase-like protein